MELTADSVGQILQFPTGRFKVSFIVEENAPMADGFELEYFCEYLWFYRPNLYHVYCSTKSLHLRNSLQAGILCVRIDLCLRNQQLYQYARRLYPLSSRHGTIV